MPFSTFVLPIAALLGVLGLIWIVQALVKLGRGHAIFSALLSHAAREPSRLTLLQSLPIDAKRRAVLVACDGREILILIGGPTDLILIPTATTQ